jgi:hypothetical protein
MGLREGRSNHLSCRVGPAYGLMKTNAVDLYSVVLITVDTTRLLPKDSLYQMFLFQLSTTSSLYPLQWCFNHLYSPAVAYFKALSRNFPAETDEDQENPQIG